MLIESAFAGTISLPQASNHAAGVDMVNDFIFWMSVFWTIVLPVAILFCLVKYHRSKKGRRTEQIEHNQTFEITVTSITLALMLVVFALGWVEYRKMVTEPRNAYEVNVLGRQWLWNFQYTNGRTVMGDLVIPINRPIKLIMTSEDVLHSFYVPNFRVKQDVVPGTYTRLFFSATQLGAHKIYCTEYCGTSHSDMMGRVIVVQEDEFEQWLKTGKLPATTNTKFQYGDVEQPKMAASAIQKAPADHGKELIASKGCVTCHSVDGTHKVGPTFKGAFGSHVEIADGGKVLVDEAYLRESIENSNVKVVKGYAPSMPLYKGTLSDQEVGALVAYIKTLK